MRRCTEPVDDVVRAWKSTHAFRQHILRDNIDTYSTVQYINEYPAIYQTEGFILAAIDTKILYPAIKHFEESWAEIYPRVIVFGLKLKDVSLTQYFSKLNEQSKYFKAYIN